MLRNLKEVYDYMNRERLASFVIVDSRNRPHVVPVFFTYKYGKVHVQTNLNSVKIRNLLRNSNVAADQGEEAILIRGERRILDSDEEFIRRTQDHI